jgi:hypothetical protein
VVIDLDTWRLRWTFDGGLAEGEEESERVKREKTKVQGERKSRAADANRA